jgi:hypothetical protein
MRDQAKMSNQGRMRTSAASAQRPDHDEADITPLAQSSAPLPHIRVDASLLTKIGAAGIA